MFSEAKVNISIENLDQFKELLQKAQNQSEQLHKTLDEISNFEFQVSTNDK